MNSTTDWAELDSNPNFTWGKFIRKMAIGPYGFVEYHPRIADGCTLTRLVDFRVVNYHVYVVAADGSYKSVSTGCDTLDRALASAIAYRHEGPNHRADFYFIVALESISKKAD